MQFKDQIDFIRQHIKKNKLRVFMTVLAATMGTAFLIVLASVGFGLHDTIRESMLSNRMVTEIQVHSMDEEQKPENNIASIKKQEHVKAVVNRQYVSADMRAIFNEFTGYQRLVVTDFREERKVGFELKEGRLPEKVNEVVVGSDFATALMKEEEVANEEDIETYKGNLIGEQFSYQIGESEEKLTLTIVGIGTNPAKEWVQDDQVYIDASIKSEIERMYAASLEEGASPEEHELFFGNTSVYVDKLENVSAVSEKLREEGYYVYSIADELKQLDVFFLALKAGLIFVGTIAILIASIGIFNTMTMAVTERTREIGVMKAIGANPKLIQRLFLMESAWIGIVGTALAVAISYAVSAISNYLLPIIVASALGEEDFGELSVTFSVIPWQLVAIASTISIGVAMISGWRPARKATKIDVIQALRQEL
ncbi:FtsX-like permease family protein [Sporosarcina sp. FSL K6-1522]|uniref:ABC transporter permease n=1 Tax=Sporosarcina sp. FSL K6-1522 TaxID=2921554 RepID=UPI00315A1973